MTSSSSAVPKDAPRSAVLVHPDGGPDRRGPVGAGQPLLERGHPVQRWLQRGGVDAHACSEPDVAGGHRPQGVNSPGSTSHRPCAVDQIARSRDPATSCHRPTSGCGSGAHPDCSGDARTRARSRRKPEGSRKTAEQARQRRTPLLVLSRLSKRSPFGGPEDVDYLAFGLTSLLDAEGACLPPAIEDSYPTSRPASSRRPPAAPTPHASPAATGRLPRPACPVVPARPSCNSAYQSSGTTHRDRRS